MKEILCPHCEDGNLKLVPEDLPWNVDYYICPTCDSTYTTDCVDKQGE